MKRGYPADHVQYHASEPLQKKANVLPVVNELTTASNLNILFENLPEHLAAFLFSAIREVGVSVANVVAEHKTIWFHVTNFEMYVADSLLHYQFKDAAPFAPTRLFLLNRWLVNLDTTRAYKSPFSMALRSDYFDLVINVLSTDGLMR